VTFGQLVQQNKRLIVGHADKSSIEKDTIFNRDRARYLFPAVEHRWANKDRVEKVKGYLEKKCCSAKLWMAEAAGAILTPKKVWLLFYGGLRRMAQSINGPATEWFRDDLWKCANIVKSDFFLGNNLIEVCLDGNRRRKQVT